MIEAELLQPFEPRTVERHRRRDQIGIEPGLCRGLDDLLEILARGRLAAGEMHLQDAHLAGLRHRRAPFLGGQLLVDALKLERVRAIGALQGTAMGELGEESPRASAHNASLVPTTPSVGSSSTTSVSKCALPSSILVGLML